MTPRESLWILWPEGPNKSGRVEVGGMIFCGYWGPDRCPTELDVAQFCALWPSGTVECLWVSLPEDYFTRAIALKIAIYPATDQEWRRCIGLSLEWLVGQGAFVSWCGHELTSTSIDAIGPDGGDGLVYAGYSKETGVLCRSGLSEELNFLDDAESALLWRAVEPEKDGLGWSE